MKINEIIKKSVNDNDYEREIGRYWASELYAIIKGYLKPEDFLKKQEIDLEGCKMVLTGEAMEEKLCQIFEKQKVIFEPQVKREIKIDDEIVLVVKTDFEFPNFIIETKFPFREVKEDIPPRYAYQLEAQYRATYKKIYLGVLTIPFNLRLIEYTPSERRWKFIKRSLREFHKKVKEVWKKEN